MLANLFWLLAFLPCTVFIGAAYIEHGMNEYTCHVMTQVLASCTAATTILNAIFTKANLHLSQQTITLNLIISNARNHR